MEEGSLGVRGAFGLATIDHPLPEKTERGK